MFRMLAAAIKASRMPEVGGAVALARNRRAMQRLQRRVVVAAGIDRRSVNRAASVLRDPVFACHANFGLRAVVGTRPRRASRPVGAPSVWQAHTRADSLQAPADSSTCPFDPSHCRRASL